MHHIEDVIYKYSIQSYFILDSNGPEYDQKDEDYVRYTYNVKRNNKLKENTIFLYRKPQRISDDKKFELYGGGIIDQISEADEHGDKVAGIVGGFEIVQPIKQGDSSIEEMTWEKKERRTDRTGKKSWKNFWNQYGINEITQNDFYQLIKDKECKFFKNESETVALNDNIFNTPFKITTVADGKKAAKRPKSTRVVKNVDFKKAQRNKAKCGQLGELIVLSLLTEKAVKDKTNLPQHVSKTIGDGLGYDIIAYNKQNEKELIEVKTTTGPNVDGFCMSYNEKLVAKNNPINYKIYRVFDLDVHNLTAKIKILDGPFDDTNYDFLPETYKVITKS